MQTHSYWKPTLPHPEQINMSKNITFPPTFFAGGKKQGVGQGVHSNSTEKLYLSQNRTESTFSVSSCMYISLRCAKRGKSYLVNYCNLNEQILPRKVFFGWNGNYQRNYSNSFNNKYLSNHYRWRTNYYSMLHKGSKGTKNNLQLVTQAHPDALLRRWKHKRTSWNVKVFLPTDSPIVHD